MARVYRQSSIVALVAVGVWFSAYILGCGNKSTDSTKEPPMTSHYKVWVSEEYRTWGADGLDLGYHPEQYAAENGFTYVDSAAETATFDLGGAVQQVLIWGIDLRLDAVGFSDAQGTLMGWIGEDAGGQYADTWLTSGNTIEHAYTACSQEHFWGPPDGRFYLVGPHPPSPGFLISPLVTDRHTITPFEKVTVHIAGSNKLCGIESGKYFVCATDGQIRSSHTADEIGYGPTSAANQAGFVRIGYYSGSQVIDLPFDARFILIHGNQVNLDAVDFQDAESNLLGHIAYDTEGNRVDAMFHTGNVMGYPGKCWGPADGDAMIVGNGDAVGYIITSIRGSLDELPLPAETFRKLKIHIIEE